MSCAFLIAGRPCLFHGTFQPGLSPDNSSSSSSHCTARSKERGERKSGGAAGKGIAHLYLYLYLYECLTLRNNHGNTRPAVAGMGSEDRVFLQVKMGLKGSGTCFFEGGGRGIVGVGLLMLGSLCVCC